MDSPFSTSTKTSGCVVFVKMRPIENQMCASCGNYFLLPRVRLQLVYRTDTHHFWFRFDETHDLREPFQLGVAFDQDTGLSVFLNTLQIGSVTVS